MYSQPEMLQLAGMDRAVTLLNKRAVEGTDLVEYFFNYIFQ